MVALSAGQAGDSPMLKYLLQDLIVARLGPGRPRTRPEALLGDKAYSSKGNRDLLRALRTRAVIPEPADQTAHRRRRGRDGGRPPAFDAETYKDRNVVERSFCDDKQWRGLATRYDCEDLGAASGSRSDPRYDWPMCLVFDLSAVGPGW